MRGYMIRRPSGIAALGLAAGQGCPAAKVSEGVWSCLPVGSCSVSQDML